MTTEQNEPQAEQRSSEGQGAATQVQIPGAGQGRRRRRRRRNKGQGGKPQANGQGAPVAANGQPAGDATNGHVPPEAASTPRPQQPPRQRSQGRQFKGNGGQNANPGNGNGPNGHYTNNGGGNGGQKQQAGGRRKGKQPRRQQVFVGPMDHSYRTANGNIADSSHQQNHNYEFRGMPHSGFYGEQDVFSMPAAPVAVREDAPVRIYFFIEDLFFVAKIQEAARKMGIKVEFAKAEKETLAKITGASDEERASLIVFDLNNVAAKPLTVIPKLKAKLKRGTSIIGFLSHLQGDLKVKAVEAGCDMVMPRSAFSQNLPNLLRRHGLDEEVEAMEA
jgi:hypothetical protein